MSGHLSADIFQVVWEHLELFVKHISICILGMIQHENYRCML